MKSIFAIEEGEYSDYHVVGIYDSKEKADTVRDVVGGSVVEWTLNPGYDEINKGYSVFSIVMLKNGDVESVNQREIGSYCMASTFFVWRRTQAPAFKGKGIPDALNATVLAKNEKHAIKIANEHRAAMIANGEW